MSFTCRFQRAVLTVMSRIFLITVGEINNPDVPSYQQTAVLGVCIRECNETKLLFTPKLFFVLLMKAFWIISRSQLCGNSFGGGPPPNGYVTVMNVDLCYTNIAKVTVLTPTVWWTHIYLRLTNPTPSSNHLVWLAVCWWTPCHITVFRCFEPPCCLQRLGFFSLYSRGRQLVDDEEMPRVEAKMKCQMLLCSIPFYHLEQRAACQLCCYGSSIMVVSHWALTGAFGSLLLLAVPTRSQNSSQSWKWRNAFHGVLEPQRASKRI